VTSPESEYGGQSLRAKYNDGRGEDRMLQEPAHSAFQLPGGGLEFVTVIPVLGNEVFHLVHGKPELLGELTDFIVLTRGNLASVCRAALGMVIHRILLNHAVRTSLFEWPAGERRSPTSPVILHEMNVALAVAVRAPLTGLRNGKIEAVRPLVVHRHVLPLRRGGRSHRPAIVTATCENNDQSQNQNRAHSLNPPRLHQRGTYWEGSRSRAGVEQNAHAAHTVPLISFS